MSAQHIYIYDLVTQVKHVKEYLPRALPKGDTLILDCEVLLWDKVNQKPLPFGSLKYVAAQETWCISVACRVNPLYIPPPPPSPGILKGTAL